MSTGASGRKAGSLPGLGSRSRMGGRLARRRRLIDRRGGVPPHPVLLCFASPRYNRDSTGGNL